MTINIQQNGTALTAAIDGRIDTQTAPEFEKAVKESIEGVTELVLGFSGVSYISSAGLRAVLAAQDWMNAKNGSMVVRGAVPGIHNGERV